MSDTRMNRSWRDSAMAFLMINVSYATPFPWWQDALSMFAVLVLSAVINGDAK